MHRSGVAKSSTSCGWGKGWNVTSAGWQVTLCDPIWHVSSSSGEACCELLYPVTLLLTTYLIPTPPQPFYGPLSGTTRVSRCQKKASSGLHGAREDNKRQTHRQSGWAPLHPDQSAIHLHRFTPDAVPTATLPLYSGLGQAQQYARLHAAVAWLISNATAEKQGNRRHQISPSFLPPMSHFKHMTYWHRLCLADYYQYDVNRKTGST